MEWLKELLSQLGETIGNAIIRAFSALGTQISSAIWNAMLQWFYETIYGAVGDFFSMMGSIERRF